VGDVTRLIDAYLDGHLDDASIGQLDRLIVEDETAAALFARRSIMHRLIVDHELVERYRDTQAEADTPRRLTLYKSKRSAWRYVAAAGAIAAGVVIAALLMPPASAPTPAPDQRRTAAAQPTGLMVASQDVTWMSPPVQPGDPLAAATHRIASGSLEFQAHSGATVTVFAPASFQMIDPMRMKLVQGRVHATVPPIARGFTVEVGPWSVVDLGTVFGVQANSNGEAEVYVYDGTVRVDAPDGTSHDLAAGQAIRTHLGVAQVVALDEVAYGELLSEVVHARQLPPTSFESLALWLSAEHGVETDANHRVQYWRHATIGKGPVARQDEDKHQPLWQKGAMSGRPVLRFDGQSRMKLPSPVELGLHQSDYEMFFVARSHRPQDVQFLISGAGASGYEQYELHINGSAGVRFIPSGRSDITDRARDRYADLPTGHITNDRPHVYTARVADGYAIVGADGVESDDRVPLEDHSRFTGDLLLGMRGYGGYGFRGEIAEVLIYRGSLTAGQRAAVLAYLAQKYNLPVDTPSAGSNTATSPSADENESADPNPIEELRP